MFHLLKKIESGRLVSVMSTVWEETDGRAKQYRCALAIYLITLLSYSYSITMDRVINAPVHGNNVVDGINTTDKFYLKEQMKPIGKLSSNNTSTTGIIPSASKDVSVIFSDQCIHILNNKEILNGLKGSKKIKNREPLFKYLSHVYNVQRNSDVNHRVMKMIRNNKKIPSLNTIIGKTYSYGSKGILTHYFYRSDPNLGTVIFVIRIIPYRCHTCTNISSLSWDSKTK